MEYTTILGTNLKISQIALGTWAFSGDVWGKIREQDCIDAVHAALECGINLIDTAPIYGHGISEKIIGKAIKNCRDKFFIATKCGLRGRGKNIYHDLSPKSILNELNASLVRLKCDQIDLYQCHWPDPNTPIELTMETLIKLQTAGKIRYIGVSNFNGTLLKKSKTLANIVTLQSQYSLLNREIETDSLPVAIDQNVELIAYGPLAGGILTGKYKEPPKFQGPDARDFFYKYYSGTTFKKTRRFLDQLESLNKPLNQIAINWVRQQKGVAAVLCGCKNPQQVLQNTESLQWQLTDDQLTFIRNLL